MLWTALFTRRAVIVHDVTLQDYEQSVRELLGLSSIRQ
jgi:hypothetical protein